MESTHSDRITITLAVMPGEIKESNQHSTEPKSPNFLSPSLDLEVEPDPKGAKTFYHQAQLELSALKKYITKRAF